jgi:hypothetical protein
MGKVEHVPGYLAQIHKGRQDGGLLQYLRCALETGIKAGVVETVETILSPATPGTSEEWYRGKTTGEIYGLIRNQNGDFWWEKAPSRSDDPSVQ